MKNKRKPFIPLLIVCVTTCVLMVGVWFLLASTIEKVVQEEAKEEAVHWMEHFVAHLNDIETLVERGVPDQKQLQTIDIAVEDGEVFLFKIFSPDGTLSFCSDEYKSQQEGKPLPTTKNSKNNKALEVFRTGTHHASINDGHQEANRPSVYVEAYVPVKDKSGKQVGVAAVFVDQTQMAASLKKGFSWIVLFLPILSAFVFLLPALGLLKESATAKTATAKAERLANFDALTGLFNRRSFNNSAKSFFKDYSTIGTLFIDVDDFKRINDEHGHDGGDALLQCVASTLREKLGENAISARFGGDEFVACIGDVTPEELRLKALDILASVTQGTSHRGQTIIGHVSIGLNISSSKEPISDMLHAADTALYKSKDKGKNTITFFSQELNNEFKRQQKLESLLNRAVDGTGLELYFQPINKPETKEILGFEALLRLRDEHGEMILPNEFIPVAERLGLIKSIGKWVLQEAVRATINWPKEIFVSVNLSAVQFEQGDLPDFIKNLLSEYNYPADKLEVEITESLLLRDDGTVQEQLAAIKELGVSIAMDDFGTGYSSLGYLWKYEFDKLKIDRSFLLGYDQNPNKLGKMIGSVIDMGHGIDMYVTMEGVESDKHADVLKDMGCDQLQGYLFGKPMPLDNAEAMIGV